VISNSGMKRINHEFFANPGRLLRLLYEDQDGCYRLLGLAYLHHVVMPRFRFRRCPEILDLFCPYPASFAKEPT